MTEKELILFQVYATDGTGTYEVGACYAKDRAAAKRKGRKLFRRRGKDPKNYIFTTKKLEDISDLDEGRISQ